MNWRDEVSVALRAARRPTSRFRALPDFLVIGAQKAGTTSLYSYLCAGRDVKRAAAKEIHFFDHEYVRGEAWYRSNFNLVRGERSWVTGEASPSYLMHPYVPERAAALVPEARLMVLFRNPVDRAFSHFQHGRALHHEPVEDFDTALELEQERTSAAWDELARTGTRQRDLERFSYLRRGHYMQQVERWLAVFPRASLAAWTMEELAADPRRVVDEARLHLGLGGSTQQFAERARNSRSYDAIPAATRQRLAGEFAPDVEAVEAFLGRPTGWRL